MSISYFAFCSSKFFWLKEVMAHPGLEHLLFERGYGDVLGFGNEDYLNAGARIGSREEILACQIICDPEVGDAEYLGQLKNQTVFGWVHAVLSMMLS